MSEICQKLHVPQTWLHICVCACILLPAPAPCSLYICVCVRTAITTGPVSDPLLFTFRLKILYTRELIAESSAHSSCLVHEGV